MPGRDHAEKPAVGLTLETEGSESKVDASPANLLSLPSLVWELREVMSRIVPEDLSAAEIAALLGILAPAESRVIGRPAARPGLHIVRSGVE